MQRTFKYKLEPTLEQREALFKIFDFCRIIYNTALEQKVYNYKTYKKSISYSNQCSQLPGLKEDYPDETKNIHSQVIQQVLKQLDTAYQAFFKRVEGKSDRVGFPRFKNQDRFRSILFPQVIPDLLKGCIKLTYNKVNIFGIGEVKIRYHRPFQGIAKQCRIIKNNEEFYLCIICDKVPQNLLPKTGNTIAIDLGLDSFATMDDGTKFHHPKPYKTSLEKLRYRQRKLAIKQQGSNNRNKQKKLVVKTHVKIANQRDDFQHKLANKIVKENDKIILEDLNIKSMLEANCGLRSKPRSKPRSQAKSGKGFEVSKRNIQDASWNKFVQKILYKAESAGREVVLVEPANTSKMCSRCGTIKKSLALKDRIYNCETCGLAIDRDINAAKNIRKLGTSFAIS